MTTDLATVPVIDLDAADTSADELARLRAAGEQLGIIQVVNHGVPAAVIEDFSRAVGRILALPRAEKELLASPTAHPYRGWRQWPDDYGRLELERFSFGQYDDPASAAAAGVPAEYLDIFAHANVWPAQEPQLRAAARAYHDAYVGVARRVLGLYARALGVDPFPLTQPEYTTFVVNDYPTWTHPEPGADDEKLLLLEHADDSVLTVLHQEGDYAGLQGQRPDGSWVPVPIVPGALQVFSGSLLTNWTNGRLRPGRHRVVAGGTVTRRSAAVFVHPSLGSVVEPLPAFVGGGEPEFDPYDVGRTALTAVEEYLQVFGRPEQVAAWQAGRPYVAAVEEPA
ncbi:isopenicillin N synthase family oxygenase [Dactylosporangium vinaceum]|uniref:2OG-Fe(II) oxygenase family protein n=1 Tax=Dactylosporangium vinaceum TaxID=53362 RepID=A0ABV5M2Y9_9ACTN|nr:2OG-Fe(II) oxygenase family protein [Dactylosporangium vinaceum]UAB99844.1 isopenicillin N synthase family oxygenase [Dactylosporangium vinaceum]